MKATAGIHLWSNNHVQLKKTVKREETDLVPKIESRTPTAPPPEERGDTNGGVPAECATPDNGVRGLSRPGCNIFRRKP